MDMDEIYLARLAKTKGKIDKIDNYSAYKSLKIILTTYLKEKYNVTIKTCIGEKERLKLKRNGCGKDEIDLFSRFYIQLDRIKQLNQIKDRNSSKNTLVNLYESAISHFA
jgi:hypothetical protein